MSSRAALLLVEDNEDDVFLMRRALREAGVTNPLHVVEDGQQAISYLSGQGAFRDRATHPLPALVLLDLKLPMKSGHEVLAWLRQHEDPGAIVVVVLTSSDEPSDVKKSYELGANSYLVKPPTAEQLIDLARAFKWHWMESNRFQEA